MNRFKYILKIVCAFIGAILFFVILFFIKMIVSDFKSPEKQIIATNNCESLSSDTFSILTWNIGYAGLGSDMDFFYEGGKQMRTSKEQTIDNLNIITKFLKANDSIDFMLLQELDKDSKRSYKIDQLTEISNHLPNFAAYFTPNYDVGFVPVPILDPTGKVFSCLSYLSKHGVCEVVHYGYPNNMSLPNRVFMYDKCLLLARYKLKNAKELVIINTHNSAFDDGSDRMIEMDMLKKMVLDEYHKGNYVLVGGDWNQNPPNYKGEVYNSEYFTPHKIASDFMPADWQWCADSTATNRYLYEPYKKGITATTLIDFFLVSPNINFISVKTIDLEFANSDHNPVILRFAVK